MTFLFPQPGPSGLLLMVGAGWGPFIMHHLAQSLKGCHLGNPERIRPEETLPGLTTPTVGAFPPPTHIWFHFLLCLSLLASFSYPCSIKICLELLVIGVSKSECLYKNMFPTQYSWRILSLYCCYTEQLPSPLSFLFAHMFLCVCVRVHTYMCV